jgi:Thrombospondin type 3 repeat
MIAVSPRTSAITGGDDAPNAPNVVFVGQATSECTGVLVTPTRVILSAHCFNGAVNWNWLLANGQFNFYNGGPVRVTNDALVPVGTDNPDPNDISVYVPVPGVPSFAPQSWDPSIPIEWGPSEMDLAVLPLSKRVNISAAAPAQLPFDTAGNVAPCSSAFTAHFFGYGSYSIAAQTYHTRQDAITNVTRDGAFYTSSYGASDVFASILPGFLSDLEKTLTGAQDTRLLQPGDSGGPMFEGSKLCGINQAVDESHDCDFVCNPPPLCWYECHILAHDYWARVDRAAAVDWLLPRLLDTRLLPSGEAVHHLHGTCGTDSPAGFEDIDSDSDGIPDGCDPCPFSADPNYLTLGTVTPQDDHDGDGIPDVCDSCPFSPNPRQVINGEWTQPDSDGDGLGDECDRCGHSDVRDAFEPGVDHGDFVCCSSDADCGAAGVSKCVPVVAMKKGPGGLLIAPCAGAPGRCSSGIDEDGDSVQDTCDNCPTTWNWLQHDDDGDGIGNECDNCSGEGAAAWQVFADTSADQNDRPDYCTNPSDKNCLLCDTNGGCAIKTGDSKSECVPGKVVQGANGLELLPAHCSRFHDADKDGLGDVCDNCPDAPNPRGGKGFEYGDINGQPNCDLLAQVARGEPYPYVGDACNPNPCNRLMKQFGGAGFSDTNYDSTSGEHLWLTVSYDPQILPNSCNPPFATNTCSPQYPMTEGPFVNQFTGKPVSTVGMRFCDCAINGNPTDAWTCHTTLTCPIDAQLYNQPQPNNWLKQEMKLVATPGPSDPPLPTKPGPGFTYAPNAEQANLPLAAAPGTDPTVAPAANFDLDGYLSAPSYASWDLTASGASDDLVGYHLRGVMWTAVREVPQVAAASKSVFQNYSNRYKGGYWGLGEQPSGGQTKAACPTCQWGQCEYCLKAVCKSCMTSPDAKSLVISPVAEKIFAQSSQGVTDISEEFSLEARSALFDPGARWLTVAERGGWTTLGSLPLAFATLSADSSTVMSVLIAESGGVTAYSTRVGGLGFAVASGFGPAPRSDFGAVLSTTENAIFVSGGKLASGELAKDLWMYDIVGSQWRQLPVSGPAPQKVIAATYLPETRSLWLVDQTEQNPVLARMLRYDLETQTMHQAGKWPRTLKIDRVELSGAPRGNLLLSGSSQQTNHVWGVVIKPKGDGAKGGDLEVIGAFLRKGTLAIEPTLSDTVLTLPLVSSRPTGSDNVAIPASDLFFKPEKKKPAAKAPPPCLEAPCHPPPRLQVSDVL